MTMTREEENCLKTCLGMFLGSSWVMAVWGAGAEFRAFCVRGMLHKLLSLSLRLTQNNPRRESHKE